jgi:GNAT superfamily N-acetyltransferase
MLAVLLRVLRPFTPLIAGTFPLGLQVDDSDVDILCCAEDLDAFELAVRQGLDEAVVFDRSTVGASVFTCDDRGLRVEVFCQAVPVHAQNGFRHMVVEGRLLQAGGIRLFDVVRQLKRAGMKTEPAFARALRLDGDPYAALLALENLDDRALRKLLEEPAPTRLEVFSGDRAALDALFARADDAPEAIAAYRHQGTALVARLDDAIVGQALLVDVEEGDGVTVELKSLAVDAARGGRGVGKQLVEAAIAHARRTGASRVVVATGTADARLLRFYMQRGFRMHSIERDAFTSAHGYPDDLEVDGVPLRDRVWLDLTLG